MSGVLGDKYDKTYFQKQNEPITHKNEYNFLINNAKNNQKRSLNIEKVVDVILMADRAKFPKSSYKVGYDAYFSSFLSIMPQDIINNVVKLGLKLRLGNV